MVEECSASPYFTINTPRTTPYLAYYFIHVPDNIVISLLNAPHLGLYEASSSIV
ncbi:hypothetical protein Hanom_Chr01g00000801 [Helianthus anomalus]